MAAETGPDDRPGASVRTEQPATGRRGPHRDHAADGIGRGREAGANSPLDPKPEAERGDSSEQQTSPAPGGK